MEEENRAPPAGALIIIILWPPAYFWARCSWKKKYNVIKASPLHPPPSSPSRYPDHITSICMGGKQRRQVFPGGKSLETHFNLGRMIDPGSTAVHRELFFQGKIRLSRVLGISLKVFFRKCIFFSFLFQDNIPFHRGDKKCTHFFSLC